MAANGVLLRSLLLSSSSASVVLDNIPQTYTDIEIVYSAKNTVSGANEVRMTLNGSATAPSGIYMDNGAGTPRSGGAQVAGIIQGTDYTANTFSRNRAYIPNYATTRSKTVRVEYVSENNATASYTGISSLIFAATEAITSITLAPSTGSFVAGCSFQVYGHVSTTATPTMIPKASGGDIIKNDGTYWYHAFLSTSAFIPQTNLTCDYIVVAGGGGTYGGGGAGGLRSSITATGGGGALEAALSLSNGTLYPITVGAGGTAGNNVSSSGASSGTNSNFHTVIAAGGGRGGIFGAPAENGQVGGSGGGGGGADTGNVAGVGGAASPSGQGFGGGAGVSISTTNAGGGGGGAGAAGGNGLATSFGGQGGNGVAIASVASATGTGISNFYAGGGSGGGSSSRAGGSGGGGAGGAANGTGSAAVINTGGGGGGGGNTSGNLAGGNGGSGIVIVRYLMA